MTPKQLKDARLKLKLTQARAAIAIGVSTRFWLYRESGERKIPKWMERAVHDLVLNKG